MKNPSCDEVEVESFCKNGDDCPSQGAYDKQHSCNVGYKLIIPKEKPFKHTSRVIPTEEILANRCSAYEFIDFDKQKTTLEDKLKSLVEKWRKKQNNYQDIAQTAKDEHTDRKFTYKAMATRDCWKELLKLIENETRNN